MSFRHLWSLTCPGLGSNPVATGSGVVAPGIESLLCASRDGEVNWSLKGDFMDGVVAHGGAIVGVARSPFSVDSRRERPGALVHVSQATGDLLSTVPVSFRLLAITPRGQYVVGRRGTFQAGVWRSSVGVVDPGSPGRFVWEVTRSGPDIRDSLSSEVATSNETIIVGNAEAVIALDVDSGEPHWTTAVSGLGGVHAFRWSPVLSSDTLLFTTHGLSTMALDLKTGQELWRSDLAGAAAIHDDVAFVLWYETLVAHDLRTGVELWRRDLRRDLGTQIRGGFHGFSTSLAVSHGHIFLGDTRGRLFALDALTGKPVWSHLPSGATGYSGTSPAIADERLYLSGFSMSLEVPPSLYCYEVR